MSIILHTVGKTDIGRVRKNNEDQFLIADLSKRLHVRQTSLNERDLGAHLSLGTAGHLLVVADGMGGMDKGEVASTLAIEMIAWYVARTLPWFYRYQDGREPELESELVRAVHACQDAVASERASLGLTRMGTTLTMAYVLWPRVYVIHVGDSRCYLRRGTKLVRMTTDHTVAQRAVDDGILTEAQATVSPLGHVLWNYIGGNSRELSPEVFHATLQCGDELLLCTDGLTRDLSDQALESILKQSTLLEQTLDTLIASANELGGRDNITAVLARLQQDTQNEISR